MGEVDLDKCVMLILFLHKQMLVYDFELVYFFLLAHFARSFIVMIFVFCCLAEDNAAKHSFSEEISSLGAEFLS